MLELLGGLLLAAVAVALVVEPLLRRGSSPPVVPMRGSVPDDDPMDAESPKVRALVALREIEFDRATGKLSEEDYSRLRAKYQREALAAIQAEEAGTGLAQGSVAARPCGVECPACGPRPEAAPVFCSSCGRLLARERVA